MCKVCVKNFSQSLTTSPSIIIAQAHKSHGLSFIYWTSGTRQVMCVHVCGFFYTIRTGSCLLCMCVAWGGGVTGPWSPPGSAAAHYNDEIILVVHGWNFVPSKFPN